MAQPDAVKLGAVTFVTMRLADRVRVWVNPRQDGSLLEVAERHNIPLPFVCRQGNCGHCAVKVASLNAPMQMRKLSLRERYLLLMSGKISYLQYENEYLPDRPALWRLACEYQVTDERIMVAF